MSLPPSDHSLGVSLAQDFCKALSDGPMIHINCERRQAHLSIKGKQESSEKNHSGKNPYKDDLLRYRFAYGSEPVCGCGTDRNVSLFYENACTCLH